MKIFSRLFLFLLIICKIYSNQTYGARTIYLKDLYRPPAQRIPQGAYEVQAQVQLDQKLAGYDLEGNSVPMNAEDDFKILDTDLVLRYGFKKSLEFRLGGRTRQVTSVAENEDLKSSGLESIFGGLKVTFSNSSRWDLAFDFQFRQTSYSNSEFEPGAAPNDEIVLGDSGTESTFMGHASYQLARNHIFSSTLGFRIPPSQLSKEIVYDLHMAWPYTRFGVIAGLEGVFSLNTDEFSDVPEEKTSINSGSVTNRFHSINREYLAPYGGLSIAFESFKVDFKAMKTVMGKSTDDTMSYSLALSFGSRGESVAQKKISKFKEYNVEATIIKLSPRGKFVKIDKGIAADVNKGMRFDIFKTDYFGGNDLIASGTAFEVGSDWSIIRIEKLYNEIPIEKGFVARGY